MSSTFNLPFKMSQIRQKQDTLKRMMNETQQDMILMLQTNFQDMNRCRDNIMKQIDFKRKKEQQINLHVTQLIQHTQLLNTWNRHKLSIIHSTNHLNQYMQANKPSPHQLFHQIEQQMKEAQDKMMRMSWRPRHQQNPEDVNQFGLQWWLQEDNICLLLKMKKIKVNFNQDQLPNSITLTFKAISNRQINKFKFQKQVGMGIGGQLFDRIINNFNFHQNMKMLEQQCKKMYIELNNP